MSSISLDDETMKAVIAKTVLEQITTEKRDEMILKSLKFLMEPGTDYNGRRKGSPIEEAFKSASYETTHKIARDMLEGNEDFQVKIKGLFEDVVAKLFESQLREKLVSTIADQVIAGLKPSDY